MGEGLKRAALAVKRTRYPGTPEVAVCQVWEDCDARSRNADGTPREVLVLSIGKTHADCKVLDATRAGTPAKREQRVNVRRVVSIRIDRFFPTSTGYRYLRTEAT